MDFVPGIWRIVRPQDVVWILLFAVLAVYGPDASPVPASMLMGLSIMQAIEPKIAFFESKFGRSISFLIKLALWYVLMAWTDGIASSYYWVVLLPVMSAATSLGLVGLIASTMAGQRRLPFLSAVPQAGAIRSLGSNSGADTAADDLSNRRISDLRSAGGESDRSAKG